MGGAEGAKWKVGRWYTTGGGSSSGGGLIAAVVMVVLIAAGLAALACPETFARWANPCSPGRIPGWDWWVTNPARLAARRGMSAVVSLSGGPRWGGFAACRLRGTGR
jgi:hypothetical protein